jgi:predicted transcriptional regulator
MMNPVRPELPLSEAQLEIMTLFWDRGELSVAEVWQALGARRPVARNTVQTLIARLEDRGWLSHSGDTGAYRYRATRPRDETLRSIVRRLVDTAFGGSAGGLVLTLMEDPQMPAAELAEIRSKMNEPVRPGPGKG